MEHLEIHCLGGLSIRLSGEPLTGFHSHKSRALLCYLAVTRNAHARSELAGLLWRDLPEKSARANLRKALSDLRRLVGSHLTITRHDAGIDPQGPLWVDVAAFEAGIAAGADVEEIERAVSFYAGDFLYGFDVRDAPEFEIWALTQRARYRDLVVETLDRLVNHYLVQGDHGAAITYAKKVISIEPWREETHCQLIYLLAASGRRSAALRQCETCRQVLWRELGVEPAADTTALCEAIANNTFTETNIAITAISPIPSARGRTQYRHNLPPQLTPFIGRINELSLLADLLNDPDVRLVTILGAGGMGKTRLALAAAEAHLASYRDGTFFVSLAPLQESEAIVPAVAQAIDFSFYEGEPTLEQLLKHWQNKQILLLLDNFEHLPDGADIVAAIIRRTTGVDALVTSRSKLRLQGEHLLHIDGLDIPDPQRQIDVRAAEDARSFDAVNLFVQSARRSRPDYIWTATDGQHIGEICRQAQGMPLALLLAAAWMEMLSPAEIAAEIGRSFDFLEADLRDVPSRHRSMRAVFESSWKRLREREQKVFASLAIFRGGFTQLAAQEVAGASPTDLTSLVNKYLLNRDGNGRYSIHELLRQFAVENLTASPAEYEEVLRRHSAYYCAFLRDSEAEWKHGKEVETFAAIEADFENARMAWQWAVKNEQFDRIDESMDSLGEAFVWHGRYQEGEKEFSRAGDQLQTQITVTPGGNGLDLRVLARVLIWQAEFNREFLGRHNQAVELLRRSEALLLRSAQAGQDTRRDLIFLNVQRSRVARDVGDHKNSVRYWDQCLRLALDLEDTAWIAYMTGGNGWDAYRTGDYDTARQNFEKALAMWEESGFTMYITNTLAGLGNVARAQGQLRESELLLRESLDLDRRRGIIDRLVNKHVFLGRTLLFRGKFEEARVVLDEGLFLFYEAGRVDAAIAVEEVMVELNLHLGQYARADALLQKAHAHWEKANREFNMAYIQIPRSMILLVSAEFDAAERSLQESITVWRRLNRKAAMALTLALLSLAQSAMGQTGKARQSICEAVQLALEVRSFTQLFTVLPAAAKLLAGKEHMPQVTRIRDLLASYPYVTESCWYRDMFGATLDFTAADRLVGKGGSVEEQLTGDALWEATAELATLF